MKRPIRVFALVWLVVAIALEFASTLGGDASILFGWVLLVWTAPFSLIYQFWIYDVVKEMAGRNGAFLIGAAFQVTLAFLFWFLLLPRFWPKRGSRNAS
jgi:hypothetical protein